MTQAQAWNHVRAAEELWIERSRRVWELDLRMLTNAGVTLARPERAADRPAAAERALRREQVSRPHSIAA
jgi:soluble lytic murein transglycosylase-like protein